MFRHRHQQALDGFVRDTSHRPSLAKGPILALLSFVVFVLLAVPLLQENGVGSWLRLKEEEKKLAAEVVELENANHNLTRSIEAIEKDPATLEKLAREEFNMHLPGEKVVLVRDELTNEETN